jgi:hypothetical protein
MTLTPAQAAEEPLLTELDMRRRIEELLAPAVNAGQLWVLFLDSRRRQLPLMIPIEDMPSLPDEASLTALMTALHNLDETFASIVLVLERLGTDAVANADRRWAAALRHAAAEHGIAVAGLFVMTPERVIAVRPGQPGVGRDRPRGQ